MQAFEIKKILVPTDFSESSDNAIKTATAICRRHGASMALLNVYEFPPDITQLNRGIGYNKITPEEAENAWLKKLTWIAKEISSENKISVEAAMRTGNVDESICSFALETRADFIVMGAHVTSRLREFFKGSKAYDVVKHSHIPVLTVPAEGTWTHFEKILFPVRMLNGAFDKYEAVRPIISRNSSSLVVLGLINNASQLPEMSDLLNNFKLKLEADGVSYESRLYYGNKFHEKILEIALTNNSDLIVITSSLSHTIKDFFTAPYAQQIVNHSKVPVLTVKPRIIETVDVLSELREFEKTSTLQLAI